MIGKKAALFQIVNLIIAVVAFAVILNMASVSDAQSVVNPSDPTGEPLVRGSSTSGAIDPNQQAGLTASTASQANRVAAQTGSNTAGTLTGVAGLGLSAAGLIRPEAPKAGGPAQTPPATPVPGGTTATPAAMNAVQLVSPTGSGGSKVIGTSQAVGSIPKGTVGKVIPGEFVDGGVKYDGKFIASDGKTYNLGAGSLKNIQNNPVDPLAVDGAKTLGLTGDKLGGLNEQGIATYKALGMKNPVVGSDGKVFDANLNQATLAEVTGQPVGSLGSALLGAIQWAAIAFGIGYLIGSLFGMSDTNTMALATAMASAAFVYEGLASWSQWAQLVGQNSQIWAGVAGIGVGVVVFLIMYKKTSTQTITFKCMPYEAPTGALGKGNCELCNKDKFRPCSEYRCKSLGQSCQLLNAGTGKEVCVWVNPKAVKSAGIKKLDTKYVGDGKDYIYADYIERPEGGGSQPGRYTIKRVGASDGCIKAFTPITFGINTTSPTQCKIDYNSTAVKIGAAKSATETQKALDVYDSMAYYFGETNIYSYEHAQTLRLPGPAALAAQNISPEIGLDGTYTLYVRCKDANENINEDEFAIRFCVEKGPDTTPPKIEGTSIPSGMPVAFNTNDTAIEVYVNEPADCKWSKQDKDYDLMETTMQCDQNVWNINNNMLYKCFTTLSGLENRKDNQFYFRCKDQPYAENSNDRNTNSESYPFVIKGSQPLNIKANSIKPNGTIQGFANVVSADLTLETENGYNGKGDSTCYYSTSTLDSSYIKMFETGTNKHKQNQQLGAGTYIYYYKCVDLGGNADYGNNTFTIEIDRQAPAIVRVYSEGSNLKVETDEKSTCYYSENANQKCNYALSEGKQMLYANVTAHYIEWKTNNNLYIKCADSSGNQPNPLDCSIIVRPYNSK